MTAKKNISKNKAPIAALLLGLFAVLCTILIGYSLYIQQFAREAENRERFYLNKAHSLILRTHADGIRSGQEMIDRIVQYWSTDSLRPPDEYVCIVDSAGNLVCHTLHPTTVGTYVGDNKLKDLPTADGKLISLFGIDSSYVGEYVSSSGQLQLAAFVPIFGDNLILGIHRSRESLEREIFGELKHLVFAFILICGVLIPFAMLMLYRTLRKSESDLSASEQRYRELVENINDAVYVLGRNGRFEYISPVVTAFLGYRPEEVIGKHFSQFIAEPDTDKVKQRFMELLDGNLGQMVYRAKAKDGSLHWIRTSSRPVYEQGIAIAVRGVITDIENIRQAETALQSILSVTSRVTGEEFFDNLTQSLCSDLGCKYAFIGEVDSNNTNVVKTLSMWSDKGKLENIEYDPTGSPCMNILSDNECYYPSRVQELFPKDLLLAKMGVESYMGTPLLDNEGIPLGLLVIMDDQPMVKTNLLESVCKVLGDRAALELERRNSDQELRESEQKYRALIENSPDIIFRFDRQCRFLYISPQVIRVYNIDPQSLIGKTALALGFSDTDLEILNNGVASVFETGQINEAIVRISTSVGELLFERRLIPETNSNGDVMSVMSVCRDITEQVGNQLRYRQLFEEMHDGFALQEIITDESGQPVDFRFLDTNPACEKMTGFKTSEVKSKTIREIMPDIEQKLIDIYGKVALQGTPVHFTDFNKQLGRHYEITCYSPQRGQFATIFQDVTERTQAQEQRDSIFKLAPDIVCIFGFDGYIKQVNPAASKILGWTEEELLSRPRNNFVHPEDLQATIESEKLLFEGKPITDFENRCLCKDGTYRILSWSISAKPLEQQIYAVARDITDHKNLEEERAKSAKLESIGVLAGGIAHDFNNILGAMLGNISLASSLAEKLDNKDVSNLLAEAETAGLRARELTLQLLTFSRGGAPVKQPTDIAALIRESTGFVLRGSNVDCHLEIEDNLRAASVDPGQISQMLNNILINADQAMTSGGTINVTAGNLSLAGKHNMPLEDGDYIKISVTDQGEGISPENISLIFDPYFTTKKTGSGLGLATCYSIVKRHSGHLEVESQSGQGTTFHVFLPATPVQPHQEDERKKTISTSARKILVMDDEQAIRKVVGKMLSHLGHTVELAENGEEAVDFYKQALTGDQPFDIVILDLTVPGAMGGREAIDLLREIDPDVKAIVSSGYSQDQLLAEYRQYGFSGVVSKPYVLRQLESAINELAP